MSSSLNCIIWSHRKNLAIHPIIKDITGIYLHNLNIPWNYFDVRYKISYPPNCTVLLKLYRDFYDMGVFWGQPVVMTLIMGHPVVMLWKRDTQLFLLWIWDTLYYDTIYMTLTSLSARIWYDLLLIRVLIASLARWCRSRINNSDIFCLQQTYEYLYQQENCIFIHISILIKHNKIKYLSNFETMHQQMYKSRYFIASYPNCNWQNEIYSTLLF